MMKVKVTIAANSHPVELMANSADTVLDLKERVTDLDPIPFDTILLLSGAVLDNSKSLAACGVKAGSSLDLSVKATDDAFVQQLEELLQGQALMPDELALMYNYKHLATVNKALKILGRDDKFKDYLDKQKRFYFSGDRVAVHKEDVNAKPGAVVKQAPAAAAKPDKLKVVISVAFQVPSGAGSDSESLDFVAGADEMVWKVKERVAASEMIPFPDQDLLLNGVALDDSKTLWDSGVKEGSSLAFVVHASEIVFARQLCDLLRARPLAVTELSQLYCSKHGVPASQALKMLGWSQKFPAFLKKASDSPGYGFEVEGPRVSLLAHGVCGQPASHAEQNQPYMQLHDKVSGKAFRQKLSDALNSVVEFVTKNTFLNIERIVKGGSVGKDTAIVGVEDADVMLFVDMPNLDQTSWLNGLLQSVTSGLQEASGSESGFEAIEVLGEAVCVRTKDIVVHFHIVPVVGKAIVAHRARFMEKQPEAVKVTMRLIKWWREQQFWSTPLSEPSDDLLELVTAYSAAQSTPVDQRAAVKDVLAHLARLDQLCVNWPPGGNTARAYNKDDVHQALLEQRPLLMDPSDPAVNVVDAAAFDIGELTATAQSTKFWH